jgi:succinyl-diaminopimelate desuccinylase
MPKIDLSVSAVDVTRQLCDIESVSGDEVRIADAIAETLAGYDLEVVVAGLSASSSPVTSTRCR